MIGRMLRLAAMNAAKKLPYFRGKFRLINLLCPNLGIVDALIYNVPMQLDLGEYIQRNIFTEHYEVDEIKILKEHLTEGDTFVDVGANVGYYSAIALSLVGECGCVISVEPTPELVGKLRKSFHNFQDRVIVVDTALGNAKGEIQLLLPPRDYGNI